MTTRLILVRHSQTASNGPDRNPRMSGWTDLPLSPMGERQAYALRERFLDAAPADALYSSPLRRARQTAAMLSHASRSPLRVRDDLREINCGEVDGLQVSEVQTRYRSCWEENLRQVDEHFRWPGGESYSELRKRSLIALRIIAAAHPGGRVLVVTHTGFISQVLGALHGLSAARWESFRPENASLTELDWNESHQNLISFNDHEHLRRSRTLAVN